MKRIILFFFLVSFGNLIQAQTLKGRILDKDKTPISDAYVFVESKNDYALSNELGKFELQDIIPNEVINISFLGFKTLQYTIQQNDLNQEVEFVLENEAYDLEQITVTNSLKTPSTILAIDLKASPVKSSQEILQKVPGLFIAQHAGGGKAEQIFLRGFDIDHGTDISIAVDGMPVNMVSHAHGQGYADLHFLIPETLANIDFGKGPYYANQGNFNTAGYVNFKTKDKLEQSTFGLEYGQFNTLRTFGLFDLLKNVDNQNAYIASEFLLSDGPVESPQDFQRFNVMGKYILDMKNDDRLSILFSHFQSQWNASGQIPQRLVDDGTITRWGSVDDTEGGNTSRTNFAISHTKNLKDNSWLKTNAFYSQYDFELFSNFTFFLDDPIYGDQIRQYEDRNIFGFNTTLFSNKKFTNANLELSSGIGLRYDDINDNELAHTANRETTLNRLAFGNINETNAYGFINAELDFGKWLINPALRLDAFNFQYHNNLVASDPTNSESKFFLSPKFNIIYNPSPKWQLFFKSGRGFHSNDTRVVVAENGKEILPAAYGTDLGTIWKPLPRLWLNVAAWYLFLEQEFVYVGDAGIVEPSGKTRRRGIDVGFRYQLSDYLFFSSDFNYTHSRAIEEADGNNRIPLAPELTSVGRLSFQHPSGFNSNISYRYIKDRPANEDNSIVAQGYFIVDANVNYTFRKITFGVNIENIFNQEWNEAQFATESRLLNEIEPVEEIHFTPGVPFFIKGSLRYGF